MIGNIIYAAASGLPIIDELFVVALKSDESRSKRSEEGGMKEDKFINEGRREDYKEL